MQDLVIRVEKEPSFNAKDIIDTLAMQFPVCMASDEFHYFPQAKAKAVDWSTWDDFSPNSMAKMIGHLKHWEQQIDRHAKQSSLDQDIDAAMLRRVLRTLRDQFELVRAHETQPTLYLTIIGIGLAEAIEAGSQALEKRLKSLPEFFDQAMGNLISVPVLFRRLGVEMLTKQRRWMVSLSLPEEYSVPIGDALQRFGNFLDQTKAAEEFLPDVALYERIAFDHMGCQLKPDDIARELEMEIEETRSILMRSAAATAPGQSWQAVVEGLSRPPVPPGGVLEIFRKTIAELSRHCLSRGLITEALVQECPVKVEPIPDYLQPVRSNAAYSMPPVHPPRGGTFFLQGANAAVSIPADYRQLTAHETYPGHHLLDTCRWRHKRPVRRHIEFPIFYEGWASFAEELMFETGLFSGPIDQMLMAKRRFWRAIRGQVDFDIHMRRRTLDQASALLILQGMPRHRAQAMVRRYCLKPGYQLAYTIGRRRFHALYNTAHPTLREPVAFARQVLALGEIGLKHLEHILRQGG